MGISAIKFEHRDGIEWVGWQQPNGDTTSDYVSQVQKGPDWALFQTAYDAWQAELIDSGDELAIKRKAEQDAKDKAEAKDAKDKADKAEKDAKAKAKPDDDEPNDRRTMAKGYRK